MRIETTLNQKIERCQGQIAAIFDLPDAEQCPITIEGFQRQLKHLLHEKVTLNIKVHQARVVLPNGSEVCTQQHSKTIRERALEACNNTIQELKQSASC